MILYFEDEERIKDCYLLLQDFYLQITKSVILLIFHNFYVKNVLYHCCTKAKDQFEPFRSEIHTSVSSEHGRGVADQTPFQKKKEAQIQVPGPIPSFCA